MSGWLGAINYGVIVANDVDGYLMKQATETTPHIHDGLGDDAIERSLPPFRIDRRCCCSTKLSIGTTSTSSAARRFEADEHFFQGHYPGNPIVPGIVLCEAGMQAGAVLLSRLAESRQ